MLLQVKNIDVSYDEFQVIWDVSISIDKGEMVALLGPNGSGKSTILNSISNLIQPKNGEVLFDNKKIHLFPIRKPPMIDNKPREMISPILSAITPDASFPLSISTSETKALMKSPVFAGANKFAEKAIITALSDFQKLIFLSKDLTITCHLAADISG